jgi:phage gp29-like protein
MKSDPQMPPGTAPADATGPQSAIQYLFNGHIAPPRPEAALQAKGPSAARSAPPDPADLLAERLEIEARPAMAMMLGQIEAMMNAAGSLEEFREMLLAGFGEIDATGLAQVMGAAMVAAHLGGRVVVEDEAGD